MIIISLIHGTSFLRRKLLVNGNQGAPFSRYKTIPRCHTYRDGNRQQRLLWARNHTHDRWDTVNLLKLLLVIAVTWNTIY